MLILFGGLLFSKYWDEFSRGAPETFRLDGNILRVFEGRGRQLWRHTLELSPIGNQYAPDALSENIVLVDLNHDGRKELLFAYHYQRNDNAGSRLLCFADDGRLLWEFVPGGMVADASQSFSPDYVLDRFLVLRANPPENALIVTTSHHAISYPAQVAVLDPNGKVQGEYWHSGHLYSMASFDLDGDGVEEILLGGVNNGYKQATLVVLDPRQIFGGSTQPPGDPLQFAGLKRGCEQAVVLFPRTAVNQQFEPFNWVTALWLSQKQIHLTVREKKGSESGYVVYSLDLSLNTINITPSNGLIKLYQEFQASGRIKRDLFRDELPRLRGCKVLRRPPISSAANVN